MGNYENLKQSITEVIRTNGNKEITGAVLQSTLLTIISTVGANATFAGIATPTTNPGTPDGPVFWIASEGGTYSNFGGLELQDGLSVLTWNGSWSSQQILSIDNVPTAGSDNLVKSGGVADKISELELETKYIVRNIVSVINDWVGFNFECNDKFRVIVDCSVSTYSKIRVLDGDGNIIANTVNQVTYPYELKVDNYESVKRIELYCVSNNVPFTIYLVKDGNIIDEVKRLDTELDKTKDEIFELSSISNDNSMSVAPITKRVVSKINDWVGFDFPCDDAFTITVNGSSYSKIRVLDVNGDIVASTTQSIEYPYSVNVEDNKNVARIEIYSVSANINYDFEMTNNKGVNSIAKILDISQSNNILDASKNKDGYGIAYITDYTPSKSCFDDTCLAANADRYAFEAIEVQEGKTYNFINKNGEIVLMTYVGLFDSSGAMMARITAKSLSIDNTTVTYQDFNNNTATVSTNYPTKYIRCSSEIAKRGTDDEVVCIKDADNGTFFEPFGLVSKQIISTKLEVENIMKIIGIPASRIVFISDIHYNASNMAYKIAGSTNSVRMQHMIDAINAENRRKHIDMVICLGDFSHPYDKGSEYFKKHFAPQLEVPFVAYGGNHDLETNAEWQSIWGVSRQYNTDWNNIRFIFYEGWDCENPIIGESLAYKSLDTDWLSEEVAQANADGKVPVLIEHSLDNVYPVASDVYNMGIKLVIAGHTHNWRHAIVNSGTLHLIEIGDYSYPPDADWNNIGANAQNRWNFTVFEYDGVNAIVYPVYPSQMLRLNSEDVQYDFYSEKDGDYRLLSKVMLR